MMNRKLTDYIKYWENLDFESLDEESCKHLEQDLLIQIGFFQHERLIHLIVTVLFSILTILCILFSFIVVSLLLLILMALFLTLLIPYIFHYYRLENGVQRLYTYYDKLHNK